MMKRVFILFFVLIFLAVFLNVATAEEKIVQLNIPGCAAWGSKNRIGAILKDIKGIKKYQFEDKDLLVVTFDDEITALDIIINELDKKGNKIKGKPVYLK